MKKVLLIAIILINALVLVACQDKTTTTTISNTTIPPTTVTTTVDVSDVDINAFSSNNSLKFANMQTNITPWNTGSKTPLSISVNDLIEYQSFGGTGAALTYSSAWLINNSVDRDEIIEYIFGQEGMGVQLIRLTVGASDFVTPEMGHYTYNDTFNNEPDLELTQFSIAKDQVIIDVLKDALEINPNIVFMAAPWSAPAWMKTNGSLYQGGLKTVYFDVYAHYLVKFIKAYQAEGIHISYLSVQNEPYYASTNYPGMQWDTSKTSKFIGENLGPLLEEEGLDTKIMIWDHNPVDNYGKIIKFPTQIMSDSLARNYVDAVGLHCYTGDDSDMYEYLDYLRADAPDLEVFMTECTAVTQYKNIESNMEWSVRRMYTEAYNRFAMGTTYWNLVMDPNGNTHLGGCSNCTGLLSVPENGSSGFTLEADGYVTGHFAKYVAVGAKRIHTTANNTSFIATGFKDENGKITLVIFNDGAERNVTIEWRDQYFIIRLPKSSLTSVYWQIP